LDAGGTGADPCSGETGGGALTDALEGTLGGPGGPGGAGAALVPGTCHGDGMPLPCPGCPLGFGVEPGCGLPTATPPNGSPGPAFTSGSAGGKFDAGTWLGVPDQTGAAPGEPVCLLGGGGDSEVDVPGDATLGIAVGPPTVEAACPYTGGGEREAGLPAAPLFGIADPGEFGELGPLTALPTAAGGSGVNGDGLVGGTAGAGSAPGAVASVSRSAFEKSSAQCWSTTS